VKTNEAQGKIMKREQRSPRNNEKIDRISKSIVSISQDRSSKNTRGASFSRLTDNTTWNQTQFVDESINNAVYTLDNAPMKIQHSQEENILQGGKQIFLPRHKNRTCNVISENEDIQFVQLDEGNNIKMQTAPLSSILEFMRNENQNKNLSMHISQRNFNVENDKENWTEDKTKTEVLTNKLSSFGFNTLQNNTENIRAGKSSLEEIYQTTLPNKDSQKAVFTKKTIPSGSKPRHKTPTTKVYLDIYTQEAELVPNQRKSEKSFTQENNNILSSVECIRSVNTQKKVQRDSSAPRKTPILNKTEPKNIQTNSKIIPQESKNRNSARKQLPRTSVTNVTQLSPKERPSHSRDSYRRRDSKR